MMLWFCLFHIVKDDCELLGVVSKFVVMFLRFHWQSSFYSLQFHGASYGISGPAGATVVLLDEDRSVLYCLHKGLGYQTNNVVEYRVLILGLKQVLKKGCKNFNVQGDSQSMKHKHFK
ncbi:unnamed protein product [Vicia faba]|uniref:RNase H type-1 domain-containing protein n=1 Tax=Vicia faba TaxID=3906 RepID=A0AAV1A3T9_VICFA|nr:unnamed protein product [Vicia faba]